MTTTFIASSIAPRIDLRLLRRDYFDGLSLLLQDEDGVAFDLRKVKVCASVWQIASTGSISKITDLNIEELEPLNAGRIRLWLTSAQTAAIWDVYGNQVLESTSFFPNAYSDLVSVQASSPLVWDVRIESESYVADLVSASGGTFITQTNHGLASTDRTIFSGTTESSINYNNTSTTIYSGLNGISYEAPYTFTIPSLSGITNAAIGGSVYRLKQDTVVAGSVVVGTTLSNCFP